jgi:large subunit ribosomal protein L20
MPRSTNNVAARARRKKYLKAAKGYFGARHRLYVTARQTVEKGWGYAFRDRKAKKRDFRRLWIVRINAGCHINDLSYSKFINGLHKANIDINRKVLAHLAWHDPEAFAKLVTIAKGALA